MPLHNSIKSTVLLLSLVWSFSAQAVIEFRDQDHIHACFGKFDSFDEYKSSLKSCYESEGVQISDEAVGQISGEVSDIFELLELDNKFASNAATITMGLGGQTLANIDAYISENPDQVYNLHRNILNYKAGGLISPEDAGYMIGGGYKAFKPTLLAQANTLAMAEESFGAETSKSENLNANTITGSLANALALVGGLIAVSDNTIGSGDNPPITITSSASSIAENSSSTITITFTLDQPSSGTTTLGVTTGGTATAGTDYSIASTSLSIADGGKVATTTITMSDDSIYEGDESITISTTNYPTISKSITIAENESAPTVSLTSSGSSIAENAGSSLTLTATLSGATSEDVTVSIATSGTSTEGTDYGTVSDITITAGQTTGTSSFTSTDDSVYEGDETAIISISAVSGGGATENGTQSQTITITENESAPTVSLTASASSIAENSSSAVTVTATLSGAADENVSITLATSGTAAGSDYSLFTTLNITAGQTTATADLTPLNETIFELDETVVIDVSSVSGADATENGTQQVTVTITNDDSAPTVTLASSASSIAENAGTSLTLTATLSNPTYVAAVMTLGTSGTASEGSDYASVSDITIAAGDTTGTASFTPTDDSTFEGDETATVTITASTNSTTTTPNSATITISEDDAGPSLSINDVTTSDESAGNATFTITSSTTSASNMTVDYATSNGTATAGSDYTSTSGTATITAGQTTTTFNVPILADTTDEDNETATITLSNPSLATISDTTGTLTITDDDTAPSLSIADVTVAEGAGTATMTVTVSAASGKAITLDYASSDGTAAAGSDYTSTSGSLSISAGTTTKTFTVPITDDSTDENNETLTLTISNASNASISDATATLTITDNDAAPSLSIADASTADESASSTNLTVTLSSASALSVTVDYATGGGTATAGADYTATSGTLTFSAGETSKTIAVAVLADTTFEGDETVTVTLSNASNASISDATGTLTISEDDAGPTLSTSSVTTSDESAGNATFTVSMTPASASSVTVDYATEDGTATSADYTSASGTLTFNAGVTSQTFTVAVKADSLDEADETVTVSLSNASGATIGSGSSSVTLTITDDDATPSLSINDATVAEDAGSASLTVTLSAASGRDVSFSYETSNNTATAGSDYTAASGSYTITAGNTTKAISVNITDDTSEESTTAETINMTISSASNASISDAVGVISITDNDGFNGGTTATYNSSLATTYASLTEYTNIEVLNTDAAKFSGTSSKDNSPNAFETINLNKALAYEKYGSGEQIAIVDTGFYLTETGSNYDHYDLSGKSITTFGSFTTPSSSNYHGSAVAGAAAADMGDGGTMGVAPSASLHLSDWNSYSGYADSTAKMAAATDDASSAVVQNNSWGYGTDAVEFETYKTNNGLSYHAAWVALTDASSTTSTEAYVTALNNFQSHGVIVFANGNTTTESAPSFTSALPLFFSDLAEAWITVANIEKSGTSSFTYTNMGNPCGNAAEFCLAADGTNVTLPYTVDQSDGTGYHLNATGTSYSAPFVSGAIALLADHFPNQTPEQWTDRLLASADNQIGFSQTGTVTFGNGVVHGYSAEAGHGMMDIYAALQPITSSAYASSIYAGAGNLSSNLRYNMAQSSVAVPASIGDGLKVGLIGVHNYFYDALGGGFKYDMSSHVSQVAQNAKTIDVKKELYSLDESLTSDFNIKSKMTFDGSAIDGNPSNDNHRVILTAKAASPAVQSFFNFGSHALASYSDYDTPYLTSKEGGAGVSYLQQSDDVSYLVSFNRPVEEGTNDEIRGKQTSTVFAFDAMVTPYTNLGMIGGIVSEENAFLGLEGTEAFTLEGADSKTSFVGVKFGLLPTAELKLSGIATIGNSDMSRPEHGILSGATDVKSSSFGLTMETLNVFGNDSLSVSISQPNRVESGAMDIKLTNLSDSDGNLTYTNRSVSISPSGRQKDLGVAYTKEISEDLKLTSKLVATKELNHVKTAKDTLSGFLGFKYGDFKFGSTSSSHRKGFDAQLDYSVKF